jgi:hypothetical protein
VAKAWLDIGLADRIGECDAFVTCASDEFAERAGYAMQEVAWALKQRMAGAKTRHLVVVAEPHTVLPTIAANWPLIELHGQGSEALGRLLDEHLLGPAHESPPIPDLITSPAKLEALLLPKIADSSIDEAFTPYGDTEIVFR